MNQKGGYIITITGNSEELFKKFLADCKLTFLSTGASGMVLKAEHAPGISSPYKEVLLSSDNTTILKITDVKIIILKLCVVEMDPTADESFQMGNKLMHKTLRADFVKEVISQSNLYRDTNVLFESIVPYVFFSKIEDNPKIGGITELLNKYTSSPETASLHVPESHQTDNHESRHTSAADDDDLYDIEFDSDEDSDDDSKELFNPQVHRYSDLPDAYDAAIYLPGFMKIINEKSSCRLGIIAMEIAHSGGDAILYDINYDNPHHISIAIETLIRFTLMTRHIHGDHHSGNIILNHGKGGYYDPIDDAVEWSRNMHCVIIDFGRSYELSEENWEIFKSLFFRFINDNNDSNPTSLTNLMTWIFKQGGMPHNRIVRFDNLYTDQQINENGQLKTKQINYGVNHIFYGWIVQKITPETKKYVKKLFLSRKKQIDSIRDSWHDQTVTELLTPLSQQINKTSVDKLQLTKLKDPIDEFLLPTPEEIKRIYDEKKEHYDTKYSNFKNAIIESNLNTIKTSDVDKIFKKMEAILNVEFGPIANGDDIVCRVIYWYFTSEFQESKDAILLYTLYYDHDDDDDIPAKYIHGQWYMVLLSPLHPMDEIINEIIWASKHGGFVKKSNERKTKNKRKTHNKRKPHKKRNTNKKQKTNKRKFTRKV